jgi:hypothetical protein
LWLGLALAASAALPAFGCLGAPFEVTTGAGGATATGASTGTGVSTSSATGGACAAPTPVSCSGACIDPDTDDNHCGGCAGAVCVGDHHCVGGVCSCTGTTKDCGTCVDVKSDPNNCGGCGAVCASGMCANKMCAGCPANQTPCANGCVNTKVDADNCGACGARCTEGTACVSGSCTACLAGACQPQDVCAPKASTGLVCGGCSKSCTHVQVCGGVGALATCVCKPGFISTCGGGCVDVTADAKNCNQCGQPCASGDLCFNGNCMSGDECGQNGNLKCADGACVSPQRAQVDPLHCGTSCKACAPDEWCIAGTCEPYFALQAPTLCDISTCGSGHICCPTANATIKTCIKGNACPPSG